ncbi:MAG: toll/interleukin-1 receptor domain-containing protein [Anaerolineales bacterium]
MYAEQGKEREKEQKKLTETLKRKDQEDKAKQDRMLSDIRTLSQITPIQSNAMTPSNSQPTYDAFISHATEDKDELVRPLAELLQQNGFSIWYDEFKLRVGDRLRHSIDKGLANSRFGIVILSPYFFAKNWPQYELDGLFAKEMAGGERILPIWHKVSKDEVIRYSPTLADRVALNTATLTIDELAHKLGEVLKKD